MSKNSNHMKLSNGELKSNVGDILAGSVYSPSLYEELFDGKKFDELISDPFLSNNGQYRENNVYDNELAAATRSIQENSKNSNMEPKNYEINGLNNGNQSFHQGPQSSSTLTATRAKNEDGQFGFYVQPSQTVWTDRTTASPKTDSDFYSYVSTGNTIPIYAKIKSEPNDDDDDDLQQEELKYDPRSSSPLSRGAAYARQYRQKNKIKIAHLEVEHDRLLKENRALKQSYDAACTRLNGLDREVTYLRQVLANDSTIAKLVDSVMINTPGLKFQFPLTSAGASGDSEQTGSSNRSQENLKRKSVNDPNLASKLRKIEADSVEEKGGHGVCFHVTGDMISLEFCSKCNRDAKRGAGD